MEGGTFHWADLRLLSFKPGKTRGFDHNGASCKFPGGWLKQSVPRVIWMILESLDNDSIAALCDKSVRPSIGCLVRCFLRKGADVISSIWVIFNPRLHYFTTKTSPKFPASVISRSLSSSDSWQEAHSCCYSSFYQWFRSKKYRPSSLIRKQLSIYIQFSTFLSRAWVTSVDFNVFHITTDHTLLQLIRLMLLDVLNAVIPNITQP